MIKVITGNPAYVAKKAIENIKEGYILDNRHVHPNGDVTIRLKSVPSKRFGSPFDRGSADAYYGRPAAPHYYVGTPYHSTRIEEVDMSEEEISDYMEGYNTETDRKEYC